MNFPKGTTMIEMRNGIQKMIKSEGGAFYTTQQENGYTVNVIDNGRNYYYGLKVGPMGEVLVLATKKKKHLGLYTMFEKNENVTLFSVPNVSYVESTMEEIKKHHQIVKVKRVFEPAEKNKLTRIEDILKELGKEKQREVVMERVMRTTNVKTEDELAAYLTGFLIFKDVYSRPYDSLLFEKGQVSFSVPI